MACHLAYMCDFTPFGRSILHGSASTRSGLHHHPAQDQTHRDVDVFLASPRGGAEGDGEGGANSMGSYDNVERYTLSALRTMTGLGDEGEDEEQKKGFANGEQELYTYGNRVVWSAGGTLFKTFTLPSTVRQATWCTFASGGSRRGRQQAASRPFSSTWRARAKQEDEELQCLCVLHNDGLTVYTRGGFVYPVVLPCKMRGLWPVPAGLLLERDQSGDKHASSGNVDDAAQPPILFSLLHPLEDVFPVAIRWHQDGTADMDMSDSRSSVSERDFNVRLHLPGHRVLYSSLHYPLLALYDSVRGRHTFWLVENLQSTQELQMPIVPSPAEMAHGDMLPEERGVEQEEDGILFHPKMAITCFHALDNNLMMEDDTGEDFTLSEGSLFECSTMIQENNSFSFELKEQLLLCMLRRNGQGQPVAVDAFALSVDDSSNSLPSLNLAFSIPALAAVGLNLKQKKDHIRYNPATHIIVIHPEDRSLRLYAGPHLVAQLIPHIPSAPNMSQDDTLTCSPFKAHSGIAEGSLPSIYDLKEVVHNRFNIVFSSGRTVRVRADISYTSPLVQDCLDVLECVLPLELCYKVLHELFRQEHTNPDQPHHDPEWYAFSQTIISLACTAFPTESTGPKCSDVQQKEKEKGDKLQDQDWQFLLGTEYHQLHLNDNVFRACEITPIPLYVSSSPCDELEFRGWNNKDIVTRLFSALHLVYENCKLNVLRRPDLALLADLNHRVASLMGWQAHADFYLRDFPHICSNTVSCKFANDEPEVNSVISWLQKRLSAGNPTIFPTISQSSVCDLTRKICRLYDILVGGDGKAYAPWSLAINGRSPEESLILAIIEEGFAQKDLETLPFGVLLPLQEAIAKCRTNPAADWPIQAYRLIGRDDIAAHISSNNDVRHYLNQNPVVADATDEQTSSNCNHEEEVISNEVACLRFGRDQRLKAVLDMLTSSKPVVIPPTEQTGLTDHEAQAEQQMKLMRLAQRTAALAVGRGIFMLNSKWPLLTDPISVPPLVLSGKVKGSPGSIALDLSTVTPDLFDWAHFHNGAATGLRLAAANHSASGEDAITSTWIAYNRPNELSNEHAGFLMALGLQGHLSGLGMTKIFEYLSKGHQMTSMGLLIGIAATRKGTMDAGVAKLLSIHLPALLPPSSTDLDVSPLVQVASLIGVGLLYQGTADRHMVEVLLKEIGKPPGDDRRMDREAYSLTAGLALGLVALARGSSAPGLADLHIEDRLLRYIYGGREETNGPYLERSVPDARVSKVKSSLVLEPGLTNVDITSPGATLAMGLMWLKSNNTEEAARIQIPNTRFLIMSVRPDLLLIRVISKNLILWDSIAPTEEWLMRQLPTVLKLPVRTTQHRGGEADALRQAEACMIAGACVSIGLRYAGSANQLAHKLLRSRLLYFIKRQKSLVGPNKQDRQLLSVCINVVALALSIVMAGSGDLDTLRIFRRLHRKIAPNISYGDHMAIHMAIGLLFLGVGRYTLSTSNQAIAGLVCAIYPHFPINPTDNRYHMQALRHLYVLAVEPRCLVARDVDTDQPCYLPVQLQLISEKGESWVDMVAPCLLPELNQIKAIRIASPRYWAQNIDLIGGGAQAQVLKQACTIYVKRKTGFLSYLHDPTGSRSILSQPFLKSFVPRSTHQQHQTDFTPAYIRSFSQDPTILAFANNFCNEQDGDDGFTIDQALEAGSTSDFTSFCTALLHECLTKEKPEMIKTYISLYEVVHRLERFTIKSKVSSTNPQPLPLLLPLDLQNVSLIAAHYRNRKTNQEADPLIQPTLFNSFLHRLHSHLMQLFAQMPASVLRDYFASSSASNGLMPAHSQHRRALALVLAYYHLPHPRSLRIASAGQPRATFVQLAMKYPHVSPSFLSAVQHLVAQ